MGKSSELKLENVNHFVPTDCGLRIITVYQYATDSILTRIDVKVDHRQYAIAFNSTAPIDPLSGSKISPKDDLITPKEGVLDCLNLKVSKIELIKNLKELVNDLENDGKE